MTPYLIIQSSWPSFGDWLILTFAVFVTLGWVLYIYFYLRPELEIGVPELSKVDWESILIPLTNKKKSRKATRIKLEVVVVDEIADTYHLSTVKDDIAFLAPTEFREFRAYKLNDYLLDYLKVDFKTVLGLLNKPMCFLRIRVHATDSFSGLGETFEKCFEASNSDYIKCGFKIKN
jgi:hypothetical protein